MNVFAIARECFNDPEQYSLVTTRAQIYASLLMRGNVNHEDYINLIDDLRQTSKSHFINENKMAVAIYFDRIKRAMENE